MPTPTSFRSVPRDYAAADTYLGPKKNRPVANNTRLQRYDDGTIAVRLHATDVVTFHRDGSRTLDSGGWRTPTTKDRIIGFGLAGTGVTLSQKRGRWDLYARDGRTVDVHSGATWKLVAPFRDGIRVSAEGEILNPEAADVVATREAETTAMLNRIRAYVKGYMAAFRAGMAVPDAGDCWLCSFTDGNTDHLESHLEESYYVPSLAWNAVAERGYQFPEIILGAHDDTMGGTRVTSWNDAEPNGIPDSVSRALTRYLKKRLVTVAA